MTPLEMISTIKPIPIRRGGQTVMASEFSTDAGRGNGYELGSDALGVRLNHPELKAALFIPWASIAYAEEKHPEEAKPEVPAALGEVLAAVGAKEPPPATVVDPAQRAARVDGIPAALQPPMGATTTTSYLTAEQAAAMSPAQLEAATNDGAQILPPAPAATKGDYPGKKKP